MRHTIRCCLQNGTESPLHKLCKNEAFFDPKVEIPYEMDMISPQTATEVLVKFPFFAFPFQKHGVRHEAHCPHLAHLSLISYPLPLQECSHFLLHYACQSESSTKALFDKLTRKIELKGHGRLRAWRSRNEKYEGIFVDSRLADFLVLPKESFEHILSQPLMKKKVDDKLKDEASLLMTHFVGLCTFGLIVCYMRLTYLMQTGVKSDRLEWWIAGVIFFEAPLFIFECLQAKGKGRFGTWVSDTWNKFDMLSMLCVPIVIIVGFTRSAHEKDRGTFAVVASIGGLLLMVKLLGFLKVLDEKLATYVLALGIILSDIKSFLIVLVTIFVAFGYAFFVLISKDKVDLHDDDPDNVRCAAAFVILCNASAPSHALSFRPRASPSGAGMRLFSRCSTWVCSETSIATCSPATLSSCSSSCT